MKISALRTIVLSLALFLLFFFLTSQTAALADSNCTQYTVPVHLSATDPTVYHLVGYLCNADEGNKVELTLHGATYNHSYWDFPFQPKTYSFVQNNQGTGFATFNVDRLGMGLSDHPNPELLTIQSDSFVAHQVIQDLRNGTIGGKTFVKVVIVGHSLGSAVSLDEAATYQDVDGVILTGFLHQANPAALGTIGTTIYPAFLDPQFSPSLAPGYLTTKPGTRGTLFYSTLTSDPQVIAFDESTKDLVTDAEFNTFFPIIASHESSNIHVPVLLTVGEKDFPFCINSECTQSGVTALETSFYDPAAQLQINVIPNTGHDLNLHTTAGQTFDIIQSWLRLHFNS